MNARAREKRGKKNEMSKRKRERESGAIKRVKSETACRAHM